MSQSNVIILNNNIPFDEILSLWDALEKLYKLKPPIKKDTESFDLFFRRHFFVPIPFGKNPQSFLVDLCMKRLLPTNQRLNDSIPVWNIIPAKLRRTHP